MIIILVTLQMKNLPRDEGEPEPKDWQSDEEPEAAKLPEWTAHGIKVKFRPQMIFSDRDQNDDAMRLTWNGTPKQSSGPGRSGSSKRLLFAASPTRKIAQSTIMGDAMSLSIGSRGLKRVKTDEQIDLSG